MLEDTDLLKCKEIAKEFLLFDLEYSSIPVIQHPFFNSPIVIDEENGNILNILENKNEYLLAIKEMKNKIDKSKNYIQLLELITKPYKLVFFKYTNEYLNEKDFSKCLIDIWITDEYANQNTDVSKDELIKFFKKASKTFIMNKEEFNVFSTLNNNVTVYRGITDYNKDNIRALSWTLDKEKAIWFANRFLGKGYIYKAKINKEDILAYCDQRNEKEIILDYTRLYDIELL